MSQIMKELKTSVKRTDAYEKIIGNTEYLTDIDFGSDFLYATSVRSKCARAKIKSINVPSLPNMYYTISHEDIPGKSQVHMVIDDWPAFAKDEVRFIGETIMLIVGPDKNKVMEIAKEVNIEYEEFSPVLTIEDSKNLLGGAIYKDDNIFVSFTAGYGDVDNAFENAKKVVEETYETPHQEHLYMEVVGAIATWENDKVVIYSNSQCPFYVRDAVYPVLNYEEDDLKVVCPPIGGGFGGKEHYTDLIASEVAIACYKTKKTVKYILDRHEDIAYTVKRQPSKINIKVALDEHNNILGLDIIADMDAGAYEACSRIIMQRCTYTATGVYNFPNIRVLGRAYVTNKVPSCAFRGFGAPQALFAIERMMDKLSLITGIDNLYLRKKYFIKQGDTTSTGGIFHDKIIINEMLDDVLKKSDYFRKREEYKNDKYRGIGFSCFLHGCAFTGSGERDKIKAKLKLLKEKENVTIFTSNTEIGQGLDTTFKKIASYILDIPLENIHIHPYDTTQICNTGPTVASRSIMIVGYLVQEASKKLKARWNESDTVEVIEDYKHPPHLVPWDTENFRGDAYPSYGLGVNVVEVEIDRYTFEVYIKNVWGVFDTGYPIDKLIVDGQIKGGIAQSLGWASLEKIEERDGRFLQVKMSDYMIATSLDLPNMYTYTMDEPYKYGPFGAKGIGELTFDGGAPAYASAIENAIKYHFTKIPILPENISEVF